MWRKARVRGPTPSSRALTTEPARTTHQPAMHVCMHLRGTTRADVRAMRDIQALTQAGLAVSVIDIEYDTSRPQEEVLGGVPTRHIFMPNWFVRTRFKPWFLVKLMGMFIRGTIQVAKTRADVYHACDIKTLPACYIAARLRRKPLIFETYELPLVEPVITRRRRLAALARWALREMMPYCAGVIAVSPPITQDLQRRYRVRRAITVRNIPVYRRPASGDRLRHRLGLDAQTRIALYQGSIQEDRSLDLLVRAARFLAPGIVIVMMGTGPSEQQIAALIDQEGVGDRIYLLPPVPYEELLDWTASADIGLTILPADYSPSIQMCLPNKLFEYIMAGLPVLTSPLEAIVSIIETYHVGRVVSAMEPKAVACAIGEMLADHAALERMHRNALIAAERELRWEVEQEKLICLYQDVLRESLRRPLGAP